MRRGVRFVRQKLQAMPVRVSGTFYIHSMTDLLSRSHGNSLGSGHTDCETGMPVLLQQHQEQHERPVSRMSKTL